MTTRAQRINARQDRIYEKAMQLKGASKTHTPTPWFMQHEFDNEPSYIVDGEDITIAICHPLDSWPAHKNASFIVRAVNSHGALIEAVESMLNAYAPNAEKTAQKEGEDALHIAVKKARYALKIATEPKEVSHANNQ